VRTLNRHRLLLGVALLAFVPLAAEIPALAAVVAVTVPLWVMIVYETIGYGEGRAQLRRERHAAGSAR
jgi:hypothetical protein